MVATTASRRLIDSTFNSIHNVRVWKATGQRRNRPEARSSLVAIQANREPVKRDPLERYRIAYVNLKSRLTLSDQTHRKLVATHHRLKAALHADYADAFASHKELSNTLRRR